MTSSIALPRSVLADCSPSTHSTASEMLDLPEPFGPTTTVTPGSSARCDAVGEGLEALERERLEVQAIGLSEHDAVSTGRASGVTARRRSRDSAHDPSTAPARRDGAVRRPRASAVERLRRRPPSRRPSSTRPAPVPEEPVADAAPRR